MTTKRYREWARPTRVMLGAALLLSVSNLVTRADSLLGLPSMTASGGEMLTLTYDGVTYAQGDLMLGTTTRWWLDGGGNPILWDPANPATDPPQSPAPVSGTSNPKVGDIGPRADNFILNVGSSTDISSLDGIHYQETIFPSLTDTVFLFERGGNDVGNWQGIMEGGGLRGPVEFVTANNGGPYANTGVGVNGQNAFGVVFKTDVPVRGVRINSSGHDTLIIAAPIPEPTTIGLFMLGLGGLLWWRRR